MSDFPSGSASRPIDEDYGSEFEFDGEAGEKRKHHEDLTTRPPPPKIHRPNKQAYVDLCSLEQGRAQQQAYAALDAYTRHKKLINDYVLCYRGATDKLKRQPTSYKTDHDVIRENHKFLWEEEDDATTWGQRLAKKYYDRLFKEYCLCDLSRYKERKIGMRWRTEKEVVLGEGQFSCGSVSCNREDGLDTWEVLFGYKEQGEKKSALVKLRLCEKCSCKLNYGYQGKAVLKKQKGKVEEGKKEVSEKAEAASDVAKAEESKEGNVWKQPVVVEAEPSKADVFEEFLEDLFL